MLGQAVFVIISLIAIATLAVKAVEIVMETVKLYCTINAETVTIFLHHFSTNLRTEWRLLFPVVKVNV